jgi:two-component system chemotaxis sensor kinase CheA
MFKFPEFQKSPATIKWQNLTKKLGADAIKKGDFESYNIVIMHDWLTTLTLLAAGLVPFFFVLDIFMMPAALLPKFAVYRGLSSFLALIQFFIVRRSRPGKLSYLHAYFLSFQVGGMITIMTNDLGGFNSSYYAGLNLIMIAANLLMPWRARHTAVNSIITLFMYLGINYFSGKSFESSMLLNNLFFLGSTAIIIASINYVRFLLIKKEFDLLVDLDRSGHELLTEKVLVEDRNNAIKSLLDVSGQGFLSFGHDFIISHEYSKECEKIFVRPIDGLAIDELLFNDEPSRENFRKGLKLYFNGKAKPDVIFDLLEHILLIGTLTVKVEYKAVNESRVMIALTDITEELKIQEQFRKENEWKAMLLKVIANRKPFLSFNNESKQLFTDLHNLESNYDTILRNVHTFKANAGFLGFRKTSNAAHELENYLGDRIAMGQAIDAKEPVALLESCYAAEYNDIIGALGKDWTTDIDSIDLPRPIYLKVEEIIRHHYPDQDILEQLEKYRKKNFVALFDRFPQLVSELSMRLGKRVAPVEIKGGEISIFPEDYERLVSSFSHLIRNMMDHGIEPPAKRESGGKPAEGKLNIDIRKEKNNIVIIFSDDGQGIQIEEVAKRAKTQGLISDTSNVLKSELVNLIFRDNFSTAKDVTDLSGRGVGLAAVMQEVKRMAGQIKVKTEKNKGTKFTILVPHLQKARREAIL